MKKWIASALLIVLLLSLLGCDAVPVPTEPTGTTETTTQSTQESVPDEMKPVWEYDPLKYKLEHYYQFVGEDPGEDIQYLPETVENPDDLPVLKWVCVTQRMQTWTEDAVRELNRMLADRGMPYRVQFVMITGNSTLYSKLLSLPEIQGLLREADLIWARMTPEQRESYLLPITEYVTGDAQPTLKNAVVHEYSWIGSMVDEEIYGIPTRIYQPGSVGWNVDSNILTKLGLTVEDFQRNFWEMDEIFAKIYKENGNQPFLPAFLDSVGTEGFEKGGVLSVYSTITGNTQYIQQNVGLTFCIDTGDGTPKVTDTLETDMVRRIQEAIIRYKDAGYMLDRNEYSGITYGITYGAEVFSYEKEISKMAGTGKFEQSLETYINIPVTQCFFDSHYDALQMNGIGADTQYKDYAVSLLNLIAEDEEFRHQLLFGKEGRDYTLTDGKYTEIKRDDGAYYSMDFLSMHSTFDSVLEKDPLFHCHEGKTKLETYLTDMESAVLWYPVAFDFSHLEAETEEYAKVLINYLRCLLNNKEYVERKTVNGVECERCIPRMDRKAYDEMLQKLNEAGGEKIRTELQLQLDEWLAENQDWQPTRE